MHVLLVEADPLQADLIQQDLTNLPDIDMCFEHASCLTESLDLLSRQPFDVVLLNWELPDSEGLDAVVDIAAAQPAIPIVVLTVPEDEATATEALRHGTQDYILISKLDGSALLRTLRDAVERNCRELAERQRWEAQMLERERLSAEVRDSVHQSLDSIRLQLQVLSEKLLAHDRDKHPPTILADRPGIPLIAAGKISVSPRDAVEASSFQATASTAAALNSLTPRQVEILRMIAAGDTSKLIAKKLGIHIKTVDNHRRVLRDKLGVQSTAAMVRIAQQHGRI